MGNEAENSQYREFSLRHFKQKETVLTPPKTRLWPFSIATSVKFAYVRVITPRLSSVTLLLTVALILSPFTCARMTAAPAPPNVECVDT